MNVVRAAARCGWLVCAVLVVVVAAGCGGSDGTPGTPTAKAPTKGGPFFGVCGGVDVADVAAATGFTGLRRTVKTPSSCVWENEAGDTASIDWFRRSPIGRERAAVQLGKDRVDDIEVNGHAGFTGVSPGICEVIVGFDADFFEWLVATDRRPAAGDDLAEQFCVAAKSLARTSIERAQP